MWSYSDYDYEGRHLICVFDGRTDHYAPSTALHDCEVSCTASGGIQGVGKTVGFGELTELPPEGVGSAFRCGPRTEENEPAP